MSVVDALEEVGKDEGEDCHQLHHDVEGGAGGVLEGIAHGVAHDGSLVNFAALALHLAVDHALAALDVFLGVIPRAAGVGRRDGHLDRANDGAGEEPRDGVRAEQDAKQQRGEHNEDGGGDHLAEGGVGGDGDAACMVSGGVAGGALQQTRDFAELACNLLDHLVRRLAHRLHGHGREPVGDHGAEDEAREDEGREERDLVGGELGAGDERAKQGEADQARRADCKPFADGGSGVARSVEGVGDITHMLRELCHFGDTPRVVADGSVDIDGEAGGEVGEHPERGERHAVHVAQVKGDVHYDGEERHWEDGRAVAEGEAVDDVGGRARLARLCHLPHGGVGVRGVVLSDEADEATGPQPGADAAPRLDRGEGDGCSARGALQEELVREEADREHIHGGGEENGSEAELRLQHGLDVRLLLHGADGGGDEGAHQTHQDARGRDGDGEHEAGPPSASDERRGGGGDHQRSARRLCKRAEEVGPHPRDIPHVVAHVIGDGRRVAWVVLGDALHNLPGEVGAHVGGLRVDAAADTTEEGDGGATETIAGEALEELEGVARVGHVPVFVVEREEVREEVQDQHGEAAQRKAHDRACAEGAVEGVGPRVLTRCHHGGAGVGKYGDPHADEAGEHGCEPAGNKRHRSEAALIDVELAPSVRDEEKHEDPKADEEVAADGVLGEQEGVGSLADRLVNFDEPGGVDATNEGRLIAAAGRRRDPVCQRDARHETELVQREEDADDAGGDDEAIGGPGGCEHVGHRCRPLLRCLSIGAHEERRGEAGRKLLQTSSASGLAAAD
mmetsp:Transcript_2431/g.3814  ORF Transcript_2431/g.3814 Transcript_2431/m.3814 type:complete len:791 (+) Transcript_2431:3091-5463(+)